MNRFTQIYSILGAVEFVKTTKQIGDTKANLYH